VTADGPAPHRFSHEAMNTRFEVYLAEADATYARQVANVLFREVDRLEGLLSRFDPSSDVAQISRLGAGESMRVGLEVFECLQLAAKVHAETDGAFDVTVGGLMNCVRDNTATAADRETARGLVGMSRLTFDPQQFTIGVTAPVEIDLGAIGKGYALDKCAELLAEWGIKEALLNSGTSTVLAIGERAWPVGIGGDWVPRRLELHHGEALSGSGTEVKGQHILDARTGAPATHHLAAWALAPSAALSDALSTAFYVMTTDEVKKYCAAQPGISALVVEKRRGLLRFLKPKIVPTTELKSRLIV